MATEHTKPIDYFVNGEPESTTSHEMTMAAIVEGADFKPASDYELEENDPPHKIYKVPSDKVEIRDGQHFTVTYTGPTQTS